MKMTGLFGKISATLAVDVERLMLIVFAVYFATFQFCDLIGIRINASPSLPLGVYITTGDSANRLIEFCPAEPYASLSIARGYRDSGACSDGGAPLLKPVVATAGDTVELSAHGISVNGVLLGNTAPLSKDTNGRPLQAWPYGRYVVAPGTVWVASSYHPRSFDSRYFGPVPVSSIRNHMRPFLTL